ncbi:MAG: CoA transferase [Burkholderiaceae bacterium]|nr:CoA transferase [Burkholderiaceae bacterium]
MSALGNVRVADFSHVFAGPYCTLALADFGAEVIKIEPPHGDAARGYTPPDVNGESPSFLCMNRNKKGIVLDLNSERGREVARDIVRRSDVVVENFATGVMERLGLGYADLAKDDPRLIYCSISAYGRSGPFAGRAGYDPVIQAESGLMALNGDPDGPPYRSGVAFVDLCTGMFATQAVLAALVARGVSGRGQFIDVPLFDSAVYLAGYHMMNYRASGAHPGRLGNASPVVAPMGLYDTGDGRMFITVAGDAVWRKLVKALGEPAELSRPEYATNRARVQEMASLNSALQSVFARAPLSHWVELLRAAGVPAGPVRTIPEAAESPETREREIIGTAPHSTAERVPNVRAPMSMSGTPLIPPSGAPVLGEHTRSVLSGLLGYPPDLLAELEAEGVLGRAPSGAAVSRGREARGAGAHLE